jgi:hypothetical protein
MIVSLGRLDSRCIMGKNKMEVFVHGLDLLIIPKIHGTVVVRAWRYHGG